MSLHSYFRSPTKRALAEMLYEKSGGVCQLCREKKILEIDHIDGNPNNWSVKNLRLLCHNCNIAERNRQRSVLPERENSEASISTDPTEVLHSSVDYQSGSPEMQANDVGVPKWLSFMCEEIERNDAISRHSSINGGASASGLTYQAILRAYNKYVYQPEKAGGYAAPYQPFMERKSAATGKRWVKLREGWAMEKVDKRLRPVPALETAHAIDTSSDGSND